MRTAFTTRAAKKDLKSSRGFSLIELLIVVAIILIIVAIAIPNLLRSRIAANEAAAVENIRTITTAAVVYNTTYANGFPPTLQILGNPGGVAMANCDNAILIEQNLSTPPFNKSGYTFAYTGGDGLAPMAQGCAAPGFYGYLVTATPISLQVTGERSFCSNEPAIIYFDTTGVTPASEAACLALPSL
ncbi:MAG TPA: prepilin-type N-terminal cleavage/methylation domain-containing protein [Candidatus Limnocylindrales bacterium]|nr:prepilin-type N-terminal cleavage/methylation domain-containing protein [Candidatus Limnocylindrales bacterium]